MEELQPGVGATRRGFVERPGCRLYFEVTGTGPALVFAHGLGGSHLSWWQQVAHFAPRHACVTFAHRGFAPSSAPAGGPDPAAYGDDLAALLDHLGIERATIVAQSMGGWSAIEFALAHRERVAGLVLSATSGTLDLHRLAHRDIAGLDAWQARAREALADARRSNIHPAAGARMAREQPALHFLYQSIDALSAGLDKEALRARLLAARRRGPAEMQAIAAPVLVVTGEEDIVFPALASDALIACFSRARGVRMKATGHSPYFERAGSFNATLDAFLAAERS